MDLVGATIGGYSLTERLGGEDPEIAVFLATARSGDVAVVKLLPSGDELAKTQFLAMAKPRSGLPPHPHIVQTHRYGVDECSGIPYVVQEFVPGPTFEDFPAELSLWHRVRCGLEGALALEYLHSYGVCHGSPIGAKHFRLDTEKHVRLVDLGNAYAGGVPPLPEPGQFRERALPENVLDDVLAYGAVLRRLLEPGLEESVTLRSIVEHCLEDNPKKRAANLQVVIERLESWVDSYPEAMFEPKAPQRKDSLFDLPKASHPQSLFEFGWTLAIVSLSLVAVAGGAVEALSPKSTRRPSGREQMVAIDNTLLVDANEVSQEQYLFFARQTGRPYSLQNRSPELPAVGVNAFDAQQYCESEGKHLPSLHEYRRMRQVGSAQMRNLNDGAAEWIDGRKVPDLFLTKSFPVFLFPPPRISEEWRAIHGSPPSLAGHALAPARYAATDIGFRCAASR